MAGKLRVPHAQGMLTEIYIEALLADEEATDAVCEAWDAGEISIYWAVWMWWTVAIQSEAIGV